MIAILAGRRIDDENSTEPRFPLAYVKEVQQQIRQSFLQHRVTMLICSGACGADLIALQVAGELGIRRKMILPFDAATFKNKSVTDRPGNWGEIFDQVYAALTRDNSIEMLSLHPDDEQAFHTVNQVIVDRCRSIGEPAHAYAVWEGKPKAQDDLTQHFRTIAGASHIPLREILIRVNYKHEFIQRARRVLNGVQKMDSEAMTKLYLNLEAWDQFAYATDVLLLKIKKDKEQGIAISKKENHRLARYIYKDHSLPSAFKLDRALLQLTDTCELHNTQDCETLGLAGAIYKRKWEYDHIFKNLESSLFYYQKGYASWLKYLSRSDAERQNFLHCNDDGWTAINYAFVNELMAVTKFKELGPVAGNNVRVYALLRKALRVRRKVLEILVQDPFGNPVIAAKASSWVYATVAEAYFGLGYYDLAEHFLTEYLRWKSEETGLEAIDEKLLAWKVRSTANQLQTSGALQKFLCNWFTNHPHGASPSMNAIGLYLSRVDLDKVNRCLSLIANPTKSINPQKVNHHGDANEYIRGKVGLALSGGGFRASLYHIGVLAALAEQDKLKDIEVISCVSGGSIVGTFYYLLLKRELEQNADAPGAIDYRKLVKELEQKFLKGIQYNLRMRIFSNPLHTIRMIFTDYSRTNRLGALYEKYLYQHVIDKKGEPIYMSDLFITPAGYQKNEFSIETDNWKRVNKVPQLILNATSVNTGHNWQFTASWMGEPPGSIPDIDVKPRLRRMYYKDAPERYRQFRLGYAVGASSCVPVLFQPMPMPELYKDKDHHDIELELIDGGLHDNQGIASLIEQECKQMIVSDASGQMSTTVTATGNELNLFYRADTILQERLRELQFQDIRERSNTAQLHKLMTPHLKDGLQELPVSWIQCDDPLRQIYEADGVDLNKKLKTGILREAQTSLSGIRTDLDTFHDVEAYSLMYAGFAQTNFALGVSNDKAPVVQYDFLKIKPYLTEAANFTKISKLLKASSSVPFKVFKISIWAQLFAACAAVVLVAGLWMLVKRYPQIPVNMISIDTKYMVYSVILFLLVMNFKKVAIVLDPTGWLRKKAIIVGVGIAGFFVCTLYLLIFNPLYNSKGRLK